MNKKLVLSLAAGLFALITIIVMHERKENTVNTENAQYSEVKASHILVDSETKIKEIKQEIEGGKVSFEDAAKKDSKCPSGRNGGDLGFFRKGMMVKEFEDAAFTAKTGDVVGPVKTQFGWHLIKVTDKK